MRCVGQFQDPLYVKKFIVYLEMLEQRGRVVVIFSELNISMHWANPKAENRDKSLRLGANLIVFAMTQQISGGLGTGK